MPSPATSPEVVRRGPWGRAVDRLGAVVTVFCVLVVMAAIGSAVALLHRARVDRRIFSWTLRPGRPRP